MRVRVVTLLAIIGVVAWWGWHRFLADGPLPMNHIAVQLANEEWGSGYCSDRETQWPCVIPTNIDLDRSDIDFDAKDRGEPYRRCFFIHVQVETTRWDYSYGGPSEPRTYMTAPEPAHACADLSYVTGDSDSPSSWSFIPMDDPPWYGETLDGLAELLCTNPPSDAAYNCLL